MRLPKNTGTVCKNLTKLQMALIYTFESITRKNLPTKPPYKVIRNLINFLNLALPKIIFLHNGPLHGKFPGANWFDRASMAGHISKFGIHRLVGKHLIGDTSHGKGNGVIPHFIDFHSHERWQSPIPILFVRYQNSLLRRKLILLFYFWTRTNHRRYDVSHRKRQTTKKLYGCERTHALWEGALQTKQKKQYRARKSDSLLSCSANTLPRQQIRWSR